MHTHTTALIVGSGITGIGAAYHLAQHNISYRILEAKPDLGGVWNCQRWHGARCDSDVIKYSFSFKPFLSDQCLHGQADLHAYLRSVAAEFGIERHIHFNTAVTRAAFDTRTKVWRVETPAGVFTANFLFNGNGYFSDRPHVPNFPGATEFAGEIVHTADLDCTRTFHDKNVVLVGSGATAICCAPELSKVAKSLVMLQRSPSYIFETDNQVGGFTKLCQQLYRRGVHFPVKLLRAGLQMKDDLVFVGFRRFPRVAKWFFRQHWKNAVDPVMLKTDFAPRYNPWEQRIPVAIGLKEKIRNQQVRVKTGEIARFVPGGIELKTGERLPCDVCVLATGFDLNFLKFALVIDDAPVSIEQANFYKGAMLGGIPNYFQPVGVWHSAWTQRSESVVRYAIKIIGYMKKHGFGMVSIGRKAVPRFPSITPNYILRHPEIPRLYGSFELPTLDNLFSYRFSPRPFHFS